MRISSALHPLRVDYAPHRGARLEERGVASGYLEHLARITARSRAEDDCDALVFLPGAREVDEVVRLLRAEPLVAASGVEVLPLHGRIPAREQDRAVRGREPGGRARIVVSTALAESSLTVPGVRLVIDSGLAREVRRDHGRDMAGLVTVSASRASAEQRAGRAAREGPGRVVRIFSEADLARMPPTSAPEIASADLVDAALLLAAWGTPGGAGLALPTPPPPAAMARAVEVLRALRLVDAAGRLTAGGREISALPMGVRDARALRSGVRELGDPTLVAEVIAAIADDHRDPTADLSRLLRDLRAGRAPASRRWRRESARLTRIASSVHDRTRDATQHPSSVESRAEPGDAAGLIVALARPDWIARRTGRHSRSYLLAAGTRAALPEGSGLIGAEWLAVHEVQRASGRAADGTGAVIRLAAPLGEHQALRVGESLIVAERTARVEDGRVRTREERRLGAIPLASVPVPPHADETVAAWKAHLHRVGLAALAWPAGATRLRNRLALMHREFGAPWPAMSDAELLGDLDAWLSPDLERPAASAHEVDLMSALRRRVPWSEVARLDELAPEHLVVPSGSRIRIDYPTHDDPKARPIVAVKLQEVFGLADTPRIAAGRVPLLFHLLSPGRHPLAVTDDLASFWNGPYQHVRREMRGRYPKHPWPEDPWTAPATSRTNRAIRRK